MTPTVYDNLLNLYSSLNSSDSSSVHAASSSSGLQTPQDQEKCLKSLPKEINHKWEREESNNQIIASNSGLNLVAATFKVFFKRLPFVALGENELSFNSIRIHTDVPTLPPIFDNKPLRSRLLFLTINSKTLKELPQEIFHLPPHVKIDILKDNLDPHFISNLEQTTQHNPNYAGPKIGAWEMQTPGQQMQVVQQNPPQGIFNKAFILFKPNLHNPVYPMLYTAAIPAMAAGFALPYLRSSINAIYNDPSLLFMPNPLLRYLISYHS